MNKSRIIVLILGLLVSAGLGTWVAHEMRVDSCLDRGGRWNTEGAKCEGATE
jgi:hypothetical protein